MLTQFVRARAQKTNFERVKEGTSLLIKNSDDGFGFGHLLKRSRAPKWKDIFDDFFAVGVGRGHGWRRPRAQRRSTYCFNAALKENARVYKLLATFANLVNEIDDAPTSLENAQTCPSSRSARATGAFLSRKTTATRLRRHGAPGSAAILRKSAPGSRE